MKEEALCVTMLVQNEERWLISTSNELCWRVLPLKVLKFWSLLMVALILMAIPVSS